MGAEPEAIAALAPRARELAAETERERRLPEELVAAISEAGLFRMLVPRDVGGGEAEPAELVEAVAALAEGDGAAGWCLAVAATSGMLAAYLPREAATGLFGANDDIGGGVFAPKGRAIAGEGDYTVTGRWAFASGCQYCTSLMGGCLVTDGGAVRNLPSGAPDIRFMLFPADEAQVIDTWHVMGLRGTGSHDIAVEDLTVPAEHSASLLTDRPRVASALYAFPVFGLLALSIAAVGLGIASGAITELVELAVAKQPTGSGRTLAERSDTQSKVAHAEATLRSARALVDHAVGEAWEEAGRTGEIALEKRTALRLAASQAMADSRDVVDSMYELGGGSSIYDSSPLQRRLRDVHVATQHLLVGPATWELAGRLLLGQEADVSQL